MVSVIVITLLCVALVSQRLIMMRQELCVTLSSVSGGCHFVHSDPSLQVTVAIGGSIGGRMVGVVVWTGHRLPPRGPGHHGGGGVAVHAHVTHGGVRAGVSGGSGPVGLIDHRLYYSPSCIDKPIVNL